EDPKWLQSANANAKLTQDALAAAAKLDSESPEAAVQAVKAYIDDVNAAAAAMQQVHDQNDVLRKQTLDMQTKLDGLRDSLLADFGTADKDVAATVATTKLLQAIFATVSILLGIGFAFLIARGISKPIKGITRVMETLAAGSIEVDVPYRERQ